MLICNLLERILDFRLRMRLGAVLRALAKASAASPGGAAAAADALREAYALRGGRLVEGRGTPPAVRGALEAAASETLDGLVSLPGADAWSLLRSASEWLPAVEGVPLATPSAERWPLFLTRENLLNVAETISVWAILGIGMTLVILTAGIDLSVGSLVALASVVAALLLRDVLGGRAAGPLAVVGASLAAVLTCALVGFLSGLVVTRFRVAPFIVTLGMMMAASGVALRLTGGTSVDEVPDSFAWLGHGAIAGLPVPVILMLVLYGAAWFVMHHTTLGRAIYAVGSNEEAARLAGIPVERVLVLVYTACGALAGGFEAGGRRDGDLARGHQRRRAAPRRGLDGAERVCPGARGGGRRGRR